MDFIDRIRALAAQIPDRLQHIQTEEATKIAFVQPFIRALGYDVNDPTEVVPELTADVAGKKGEKVDYAIFKDGKPIILIECKWSGASLNKVDASQLERYFMVTEARLGVLTNGLVYRFYSDLEKPNLMDKRPFLELNLLDIQEPMVEELKKFSKDSFDINDILSTASELKYTKEIKRILAEQLTDPSDDFVRFFARQVYSGVMTQSVREQFGEVTKRAFHQLIADRISDRLQSAALAEETTTHSRDDASEEREPSIAEPERDEDSRVVTTPEEIEGYYIVKSILREVIDVNRVTMRDRLNYCGILLDNNQRKPICRLHFDRPKKYLGVFDEHKRESRIYIERLDDIYSHADRLKVTVGLFDDPAQKVRPPVQAPTASVNRPVQRGSRAAPGENLNGRAAERLNSAPA